MQAPANSFAALGRFCAAFAAVLLLSVFLSGCRSTQTAFKARAVYQSPTLLITQVAPHAWVHTSYKQTNDFGKVPCNGLLVSSGQEAVVFDTPTDDAGAAELLRWVDSSLHCQVKAVIPTHFHDDCLGGLQAFHQRGIASYAHQPTVALAAASGLPVPQQGFSDSLILPMGSTQVEVRFMGEGHTRDNVVGYFAAEQVLFGGCLIKELNASKGYLGDANLAAWSGTVERVQRTYPQARVVVPGHGAHGSSALLAYMVRLFQQ